MKIRAALYRDSYRRFSRLLSVLLVSLFVFSNTATASIVAPSAVKVKGKNGQILIADKAKNLNPKGVVVTVTGKNFDERVGIYVALCVVPKKGQQPTPCGGGVDMDGSTSASKWISSNPPSYGLELAKPFSFGGNFKVKIKFNSKVGNKDCRKVKCAITTRADHLQTDDRSADVFIPVTFK